MESDIKKRHRLEKFGMVPEHSFIQQMNSCLVSTVPEGFYDEAKKGAFFCRGPSRGASAKRVLFLMISTLQSLLSRVTWSFLQLGSREMKSSGIFLHHPCFNIISWGLLTLLSHSTGLYVNNITTLETYGSHCSRLGLLSLTFIDL